MTWGAPQGWEPWFIFPAMNSVRYLAHSSHSINAGGPEWNCIIAILLGFRGPCRSHGSPLVHFLRTCVGVWRGGWQKSAQELAVGQSASTPVMFVPSVRAILWFQWPLSCLWLSWPCSLELNLNSGFKVRNLSCSATREMIPKSCFLQMSPPSGKLLAGQGSQAQHRRETVDWES